MLRWRLAVFALSGLAAAFGQSVTAPAAATGIVTGHVTCADTQLPARWAEVSLVRRPDPPVQSAAAESKPVKRTVYLAARSALDGSYRIADVPPGDYFVLADMAGYVLPLARLANQYDEDEPGKLADGVAWVHVVADHRSEMDITLERGGVLSGRVLFDDGSPLPSTWVEVDAADGRELQPGGVAGELDQVGRGHGIALTDDEGRYRISGLEPGKYVVLTRPTSTGNRVGTTSLQSSFYTGMSRGPERGSLTLYAPGVFAKSDAKVYEIKGTEVERAADIQVPLSGLHTVRGHISGGGEEAVPVLFVTIYVKIGIVRAVSVAANGTFQIEQVPKGTYEFSAQSIAVPVPVDAEHVAGTGVWRLRTTLTVGESDVDMGDLRTTLVRVPPPTEQPPQSPQ